MTKVRLGKSPVCLRIITANPTQMVTQSRLVNRNSSSCRRRVPLGTMDTTPSRPSAAAAAKRVERLVRQVQAAAEMAVRDDGRVSAAATAAHPFNTRAMSRWLIRYVLQSSCRACAPRAHSCFLRVQPRLRVPRGCVQDAATASVQARLLCRHVPTTRCDLEATQGAAQVHAPPQRVEGLRDDGGAVLLRPLPRRAHGRSLRVVWCDPMAPLCATLGSTRRY